MCYSLEDDFQPLGLPARAIVDRLQNQFQFPLEPIPVVREEERGSRSQVASCPAPAQLSSSRVNAGEEMPDEIVIVIFTSRASLKAPEREG